MDGKGIIYYTDNLLSDPPFTLVQKLILKAGLPITSCSLQPIAFGNNVVVEDERCYTTMVRQIIMALDNAIEKYVFFCEHDVLYSKSHFDFTPPRDDIYYYNTNNWRWRMGNDKAVKYDRMISLSGLCVNRELALKHYRLRLKTILDKGFDKIQSKEPAWARKMGYEPGTKKKKRGGLTDEDFETWESELPNIDIRHDGTFSPPKVTLDSFKHLPTNWQEIEIDELPGWNLRKLFLWPSI